MSQTHPSRKRPITILASVVFAAAIASAASAQAVSPITNFVGAGAGAQFRQAINDRLYGAQPITPAFGKVAFSALPGEADGALLYCTNCSKTTPCTVGGPGAFAFGQNGNWSCSAGAAGSSFPLTAAVSAAGFPINAQPAGVVTGQSIVYGQAAAKLQSLTSTATGVDSISNFSVNGVINLLDYGADPTGVADSSPAWTLAMAAACAAQAPLSIPPGTYKAISQPFLHECPTSAWNTLPDIIGAGRGSVTLESGDGASMLMPTIVEASNALVATNLETIPVSPLVGSTGHAAKFSGFPNLHIMPLDYVLGSQWANGDAAFTVEGFFNSTSNAAAQVIISSDGSPTPIKSGCGAIGVSSDVVSCQRAFTVYKDNDGKLYAAIKTSTTGWSGVATLKSASALTANTTYYFQLSYDGSFARLYYATPGSALISSGKQAMTGTIAQDKYEDTVIGAVSDYWHLVAPSQYFAGTLDSIRISNTARCTDDSGGCTAPSAKLGGDANTVFLENWSNTQFASGSPLVSPEYINGTAASAGAEAWTLMLDQGDGNSEGFNPHLHDFSILGNSAGIVADSVSPFIDDVGVDVNGPFGIDLAVIEDYNDVLRKVYITANTLDLKAAGLTQISDSFFVYAGAGIETSGEKMSGLYFLPASAAKFGVICNGFCSVSDSTVDNENGSTGGVNIQLSNMAQASQMVLEVSNTSLVSDPSQPVIAIDGNAANPANQISLEDVQLSHAGGTGPYVASGTMNGSMSEAVLFKNPAFVGTGGPIPASGDSYVSSGTFGAGTLIPYCVESGIGSTCFTKVGGLAACTGGPIDHQHMTVTDANAGCSAGTTAAGGGTTYCDEYCAGASTAWKETGN